MGKMFQQVNGILDMTVSELEKAIEIHSKEQVLSLQLIDGEIVNIFPDWTIQE